MARGDQLNRQWELLRLLQGGRKSRAELAKHFGVDTKTIKRDVEETLERFFPIQVEKDSNIVFYHYIRQPELPIPAFTAEEREALVMSQDMIQDALRELPFADSLQSAFERIVRTQAEGQRRRQEHLPQIYHSDFSIPEEETSFQREIEKAAVERKMLRIAYMTRSRMEENTRTIEPLALHLSVRGLQLLAYCHLRERVLVFAVRSIKHIEVLSETFDPKRHKHDLEHYLHNSFDGYREGEVKDIHLVIRGECAHWAGHRHYHPTQVIEECDDGSVSIRFRSCGEKAILRRIMMFGADCDVISPKSLRDAHTQMIEQMYQRLQRTTAEKEVP